MTFGMDMAAPLHQFSIMGGAASSFRDLDLGNFLNSSLTAPCQRRMLDRPRTISSEPFSHYQGKVKLGQLYCRTGYHLEIGNNGVVQGTYDDRSKFGVLEFISVAFSLVLIRGRASGKYLCMEKNKGILFGSDKHGVNCVFLEMMLENYYNTYASCYFPQKRTNEEKVRTKHQSLERSERNNETIKWYVSIDRKGSPKHGKRSKKSKKKRTQFLVLQLSEKQAFEIVRNEHRTMATELWREFAPTRSSRQDILRKARRARKFREQLQRVVRRKRKGKKGHRKRRKGKDRLCLHRDISRRRRCKEQVANAAKRGLQNTETPTPPSSQTWTSSVRV